jgi:hypothetical protein
MVPGSEIRDPEKTYSGYRIPDPGVKKHPIPDPGSGSATLVAEVTSKVQNQQDCGTGNIRNFCPSRDSGDVTSSKKGDVTSSKKNISWRDAPNSRDHNNICDPR